MSTDDTQPARQPSAYDRSKEPRTVRLDPNSYQPPSGPPRGGKPGGWPEQPPQSGSGSGSGGQYGGSGSGGQYGSSGSGGQYGDSGSGGQYGGSGSGGQYGSSGSGGQYGGSSTAPYGSEPGYTPEPGYGSPAYGPPGAVGSPSAPPPGSGRRPRRRRRHRGITMAVFIVIVLLVLAVIGDQVGKAVAENQFASQVTTADPQIHPSITIKESLGDPFLAQIVTHDLTEVDISASNIPVPAGPVTLMITSVNAVAKGLHINSSFSGGKVDNVNATVFIGYSSLSSAVSSQTNGIANLTLSSAGNGQIKASFGALGINNIATETGKITLNGNQVNVTFTGGGSGGDNGIGGIIGSITGGGSGTSLSPLSFTIPKLPAGVKITGFTVGSQGITIMGSAQNQSLSQ